MRFAVSLPWWGYVAIAVAGLGAAWFTYASARVDTRTRAGLTALRALVLLLLAAAVLRPVQVVAPIGARDRLVAILVDVSRSMRIADAQGPARLQRAIDGCDRDGPEVAVAGQEGLRARVGPGAEPQSV